MAWKPGDHLLVRGTSWLVVRSIAFADCVAVELRSHATATLLTLLLPFDRPRPTAPPRFQVVSRRRWARIVAGRLRSEHPYGALRAYPASIQLLPYQLEPALAMLRHGHARVLLADDVGLGKTIQAGIIVREIGAGSQAARILVVTPASLRDHWIEELRVRFDIQAVDADASWLRRVSQDLPPDVNPWSLPGVYVASMDFVKRPEALHPLESARWELVVLDEAHAATPASDRRAAIHALALRSRRVLLLSATPHSGDETQFADLCAIGADSGATPIAVFSRTRADTPLAEMRTRSRVVPVKLSETERAMHQLLDDYTERIWRESQRHGYPNGELVAAVLRKRALSSPRSLAQSVARRLALIGGRAAGPDQLFLPLEDDIAEDVSPDAVLGDAPLADCADERRRLDALAKGAGAACASESKVRVLLRLLRRVREPALIFTEYRDTAEHLLDQLTAAGREAAVMHGGLSQRERGAVLARFAREDLLLVATDAASEGLNLHQRCRLVIHFELPWTPLRLHQRRGRVSRIGQQRPVHELALVANDTCEQMVLLPLLHRAGRAGRFARSPLMNQLSESRVAAHILGAAPLGNEPGAPTGRERLLRLNLASEAALEASRLTMLRRLDQRPRAGRETAAPGRAIVPMIRSPRGSPCARHFLTVVLRASLAELDGRQVDDQILLVVIDAAGCRWSAHRSVFKGQIGAALSVIAPQVAALAERFLQERRSGIAGVRDAAIARRAARDELLRQDLRSTARDLVQAGLFDRRATRASAARERARTALLEQLEAEPPAGRESLALAGTYEIVAVAAGGKP
jgi:superfamily II DNA or RNA helicase